MKISKNVPHYLKTSEMSGDKAWNCYMDFIDFGDNDFNKFSDFKK